MLTRPRFAAPLFALTLLACGAQSPPPETAAAGPPRIDGATARGLVAGGAVLLDVTPHDRADRSAIEGRTHIPLPELADRMSELPRDRPIVVYCLGGRGSPRGAAMLHDAGFDARLLGARSRWDE